MQGGNTGVGGGGGAKRCFAEGGGERRCYAEGFHWIALDSTRPKQEREIRGVGLVWSGCRWGMCEKMS